MSPLVFDNGPIYPMDRPGGRDWALATSGEQIDYVGPRSELPAGDYVHVDLAGRPLLPGFCDSHLHLVLASEVLAGFDAGGVDSVEELGERVRARAQVTPTGEWITGFGWEKKRIFADRPPSVADADAMAPDHPTFLISRDLHSAWLNSRALACLDALEMPRTCVVHRVDGRRTGLVHEAVIDLRRLLVAGDAATGALAHLFARLHAAGITTVHNNESVADFARVRTVLEAGGLGVRVLWNFVFDTPEELGESGHVFHESVPGWLVTGGAKLFLDGSFGSLTAAVGQPYTGSADDHGILNLTDDELDAWLAAMRATNTHGVFHAIGDRAVAQVLERLARVDWPARTRHRIEHAQLLSSEILERFDFAHLAFSVQPSHIWGDRDIVARHLGDDRFAFAYATMRAGGGLVVFGSDAPVADVDPWSGICAAVTRTGVDGAPPWNAREAFSALEAVAAHTSAPARLHPGLDTGVLRRDAPADLVVLDRDPFTLPPSGLRDVQVDMTVSAGRVVYER